MNDFSIVYTESIIDGHEYKGDFKLCDYRDKWYGATDIPTAHKATVKELIEHFSALPLKK